MTADALFSWAGLGIAEVLILCLAAWAGSFLTAALGVGGGAFLLIVMADYVPPLALIPLHGLVQLGSNANRAWLTRHHLRTDIAWPFILGTGVAAMLSVWFLGRMEVDWIPLLVAGFILWLCWGPMPQLGLVGTPAATAAGGFLTTLCTMVFGATGPLVSAWLGRGIGDRWVYTACFSSCMSAQHLVKIVVFMVLGFSFWPWLMLGLAMILAGYLGTLAGLKMLNHLPEALFRKLFRWLLTALALRVIWQQLSVSAA